MAAVYNNPMTFLSLCLLWLTALPPADAVLGPYVTLVTPTSATVMWATGPSGTPPAFQVQRKEMTGLKPGKRYEYDIPSVGKGSFTTPPKGDGDFNFVVFGDNRTRHDVYRQVSAAVAAAKPVFVVHTGDQVAAGKDASLWPIFFEISQGWMREAVLLPALGNHEQNSPFWYQFYGREHGYYSQDWGPIHWVILDSDFPGDAEASWKEQLAFLEQDLAAHKSAKFRFVAFHHPPYTAVARRQASAAKIAERLVPVFRKYGVQAVICGHDHNYQRHVVDGIQYVVAGGGGAPLYDVDGVIPGTTVKAEKVENYVYAELKSGVIRFEARTPDGRVIDKFEISAKK